jgi:hypothetical protein
MDDQIIQVNSPEGVHQINILRFVAVVCLHSFMLIGSEYADCHKTVSSDVGGSIFVPSIFICHSLHLLFGS